MKLKFLYALSLLLCLGTVASSHERMQYCGHRVAVTVAASRLPEASEAAGASQAPDSPEHSDAVTVAKLLYI